MKDHHADFLSWRLYKADKEWIATLGPLCFCPLFRFPRKRDAQAFCRQLSRELRRQATHHDLDGLGEAEALMVIHGDALTERSTRVHVVLAALKETLVDTAEQLGYVNQAMRRK